MIDVFRATQSEQTIGQTVEAPSVELNEFDTYWRPAEELLEERRPETQPSRLNCLYACDQAAFAAKYLEAQIKFGKAPNGAQPWLYRVRMKVNSPHPMCLVDEIAKYLAANKQMVAVSLADEYWVPTCTWKFLEFLAPQIEVLSTVPWPKSQERWSAGETYNGDRQKRLQAFLQERQLGD